MYKKLQVPWDEEIGYGKYFIVDINLYSNTMLYTENTCCKINSTVYAQCTFTDKNMVLLLKLEGK
jgi:hypothetical protein